MAAGRPPRVASSQWKVGSHLVSVCCLPKDGPGGSPAAAPFLEPRRRESPRGAAVSCGCAILLSKMRKRNPILVALARARAARAGAPGGVFNTPSWAQNSTANIGDTICLVSSPSNSPAAGGARPRHRLFERRPADRAAAARGSPSRQPRAAREGRGCPGCISNANAGRRAGGKDGRRRLHPDAQEARPKK